MRGRGVHGFGVSTGWGDVLAARRGREPPGGLAVGQRAHGGDDLQPRHHGETFFARPAFGGVARQAIEHGGRRLARQRQFGRRRAFIFLGARHAAIDGIAVQHRAIGAGDGPGDIGAWRRLRRRAWRRRRSWPGAARPRTAEGRHGADAAQQGIAGPARRSGAARPGPPRPGPAPQSPGSPAPGPGRDAESGAERVRTVFINRTIQDLVNQSFPTHKGLITLVNFWGLVKRCSDPGVQKS